MNEEKMQLFNGNKVRTVWDDLREECYFSVVDVVGVRTWRDFRKKSKKGVDMVSLVRYNGES